MWLFRAQGTDTGHIFHGISLHVASWVIYIDLCKIKKSLMAVSHWKQGTSYVIKCQYTEKLSYCSVNYQAHLISPSKTNKKEEKVHTWQKKTCMIFRENLQIQHK